MDTQKKFFKDLNNRKGERGAALVTVLMISFLLLVAVIALILESSMNTANVTDATSEEQAYFAAESGVQSVIDALRHNPRPSPLVDSSKPASDEANQIDYLKAVRRSTSNICPNSPANCTDSNYADAFDRSVDSNGNPQPVRLSRWIKYNWGPNGGTGATNKDRVVLGNPNTYSPLNGFAFSASVSDPDSSDGHVKYSVPDPRVINSNDGAGYQQSVTHGGYAISYTPPTAQDIDVNSGLGTGGSLGSFTIAGDTTTIPNPSATPAPSGGAVRFKIVVDVSQPANNTLVVRGYIVPPGTAFAGCTRTAASILFDSEVFLAFGSRIRLNYTAADVANAPGCTVEESGAKQSGPYNTYLTGFMVQPNVLTGINIPVTVTQPEPTRLLVRSVGYGPRGARKELETIIQKNYFDGLGSPSPLLMLGPTCTRPGPDVLKPNCISANGPGGSAIWSEFTATGLGNSSALSYSGKDSQLKAFLPPIGVTNDENLQIVQDARLSSSFKGTVYGTIENVRSEMPRWLQSPANLDRTVQLLRDIAKASGTCPPSPCSYYPPGVSPPTKGVYGDLNTASGITFVDGNADISGEGGGILVVTGQLKFGGGMAFNGLVLITGQGGFLKSGAGNGTLAGTMIVAPYNQLIGANTYSSDWSLRTCMVSSLIPDKTNCFYAPQYNNSGGGTGDLMFNSTNVLSSLNGIGNLVKGVAEK